jgi:hypothetical protein
MKKIILLIIMSILFIKVNALESIKINNETLSPLFDNDIKVYNYFTNNETIKIVVNASKGEVISGYGIFNVVDGINTFNITSSKYGIFKINVYKNYSSKEINSSKLTNIVVAGYDIGFDPNKYDYSINIEDETYLKINYELEDDSSHAIISGNGELVNTDNIINIEVTSKDLKSTTKYVIHAYKTIEVSNIKTDEEIKVMSPTIKEIVKLIIVTISVSLIVLAYYLIFIKKTILHI